MDDTALNPTQILKRLFNGMLSRTDAIELLKKSAETGAILQTDSHGNNVLHWLVDDNKPATGWIQYVLKLCPALAVQKNEEGLYPHEAIRKENSDTYKPLCQRWVKQLIYPYLPEGPVKHKLFFDLNIKLSVYSGADKKVSFNKPTLLCLGGVGSWNSKNAKGISKLVSRILNVDDKEAQPFQVVSVKYPGTTHDLNQDLKSWDLPDTAAISPAIYVNNMVDYYFMPLLQNEEGKRLSCTEACKNMRAINMVAYSYGGVVAYLTEQQLNKRMLEMGYSTTETDRILQEVFLITFGSVLPLEDCMTAFTAIHVINADDPIIDSKLGKHIVRKFGYSENNMRVATLNERPNEKFFIIKQIPLDNFLMPDGTKRKKSDTSLCGHDDLAYFSTGLEPEHMFMSVLRYCLLTNTVNNSIRNARTSTFKRLESFKKLFDFPTTSLFKQLSPVPGFTCRNMQEIGRKIGYKNQLEAAYLYNPERIDPLDVSHQKMIRILINKYKENTK